MKRAAPAPGDKAHSEPSSGLPEETPDWFRAQFLESQARRRDRVRETEARWEGRLRRATLLGAAAGLLGGLGISAGWSVVMIIAAAGGLSGHLVARWELSLPGGAALYGASTIAACQLVSLSQPQFVGFAHVFCWLLLTIFGALLSYLSDQDRLEHLPF